MWKKWDPKNPKKKKHVTLANPEFLIAYQKEFPQGLKDAKYKILSQEGKSDKEKKLEYRKLLQNVIKADAGANNHHIEQMMVHFFPQRIQYLIGILDSCPRNTLVLAQHVEYIKYVAEEVKKAFPDRPVMCIYGASKERKNIKQILSENDLLIYINSLNILLLF